MLAPRPLTIGQVWINGKEVYKFEGIEDFETFNTTVPACLKITVTSQGLDKAGKEKAVRDTKYYERGVGLIYKSSDGAFSLTKILSRYAGAKSP